MLLLASDIRSWPLGKILALRRHIEATRQIHLNSRSPCHAYSMTSVLFAGVQPGADGGLAVVGHLAGAVPVRGGGAVGGRALAAAHGVAGHPPPHPPRLLLPHPPAPASHLHHGIGGQQL